jgi:hypothetical protein
MRLRSWLEKWSSHLKSQGRSSPGAKGGSRKSQRACLRLEQLEDRIAPVIGTFTNETDVTVDGSSGSVTFPISPGGFGATATINKLTISVTFDKFDTGNNGPLNNEIVYRLTSPAGTTVNLVNAGTYSASSPDVFSRRDRYLRQHRRRRGRPQRARRHLPSGGQPGQFH